MNGANLANGSKTAKRRELDFYPTPPEATHALMRFLKLPICRIWEPACGDGAMSKVLSSYGHKVVSTDLRDTGFGEGGVDFLETPARLVDAIITNPPFAQSQTFISRATFMADTVAMLLKSQYWHAQKRLSLFRLNPPAWVLPLTWRPDFMGGASGGAPTMEVHWTVWIKGQTDTRMRLLEKPGMDLRNGELPWK